MNNQPYHDPLRRLHGNHDIHRNWLPWRCHCTNPAINQ